MVGIIKDISFLEWHSNPVVVSKLREGWCICIDFTDFNKAIPKKPYPLPRINQLVDSMAGYEMLPFLDAFKGYHQILMA